MHYFATDGNYGDATDLIVVDTDNFTEHDWDRISESTDSSRIEHVKSIITGQKKTIALDLARKLHGNEYTTKLCYLLLIFAEEKLLDDAIAHLEWRIKQEITDVY